MCVACTADEHCSGNTPVCDTRASSATLYTCQACATIDPTKPVWNGTACVVCTDNSHCSTGQMCDSATNTCKALDCAQFGKKNGLSGTSIWGDSCNRYAGYTTELTPYVIYHGTTYGDKKTCNTPLSGYFCFLTDKTVTGTFAKHTHNSNSTATLDGKNMLQNNTWTFKAGECYSFKSTAGAKRAASRIEIDTVAVGADLLCR